MSNAPVNSGRRKFLTLTTAVVGGVGAAAVAVPFVKSWSPSEKAKAAGAPVAVDVSKIQPGQLIRVEWRGKPVWIVSRTQKIIDELASLSGQLRDPDSQEPQQPEYASNINRSLKEEIFVAVGLCTHLGCSPTYLPDSFGEQVEGIESGFFCPCHGSKFDMAGRVFQNVPAPLNLVVPPHHYVSDTQILIGLDKGDA
ncbi:ubiquinol-cytochrome c reductase iron-sulfur subunit [Psychromonas ossibalaenae]|uniref:ubiquinol-cytochrome c reductase iron-sulfur subunit n=1 Tax=Psychromonas ossibalaenae TaxID=444922 RepID=UPI00037EAF9C|nr:ubiquinol-cytochrome c reductase iron-sulfur subunit [Psychromonas ossibalaenae]